MIEYSLLFLFLLIDIYKLVEYFQFNILYNLIRSVFIICSYLGNNIIYYNYIMGSHMSFPHWTLIVHI